MSQKVIIAEDDVILREILIGKLSAAGFVAIGAEDGDGALQILSKEKPDLLLLDILLPGKTGIEVLKAMQQDITLKSIPVIAISNSDDADSIREAKTLGVKDFLIKAIFDSSDVIEKVKIILAGKTTPAVSATPIAPVGITSTIKKTVLIVEDDKFLREIATQKLETEGFEIVSMPTGNEAIEYLSSNSRPDIIVLDLILPGMSGFEVLEKIRQNMSLKATPILILSNLGQEEDIEKAKKLGATDYLVKAHFSFAEIIKKIHEIVG